MRRHVFSLVVACACATFSGCAAPTSPPASSSQQVPATTTPKTGAAEAAEENVAVNIEQIFPAAAEREILLNNCTSCHTFVPIVVLQMDQEAWERNKVIHRSRVPALGDAEFDNLYKYLIANFNPNRQVPRLPKELLDTWTSY